MPEPCEGKLSGTVLRGLGAGNSPRLPDFSVIREAVETSDKKTAF